MKLSTYAVLGRAENKWAEYSPGVPDCIATGRSPEETIRRYEKALRMHLHGLHEDRLPPLEPTAGAVTVNP